MRDFAEFEVVAQSVVETAKRDVHLTKHIEWEAVVRKDGAKEAHVSDKVESVRR